MSLHISETTHHGVDKVSRYRWSSKNEPGRLEYIHKSLLQVDHSYQRKVSSGGKVLAISKNWNWVSLGAIIVCERPDGSLFVVDGQHRVIAAMSRSDVQELPCVIHCGKGQEGEAVAFIETNTARQPVKSSEQHKARLLSGDETAQKLQYLLDSTGKKLAKGGSAPNTVKCVGLLRKLIELDWDATQRIWPILSEISEGEYLNERVISGVHYIERRVWPDQTLTKGKWAERLRKVGNDGLSKAAGEGAAFFSKGGEKPWATGILNSLNKGMRSRLEVEK